jgi:photosystem II stability/assembly factor-like uncharacterized protein
MKRVLGVICSIAMLIAAQTVNADTSVWTVGTTGKILNTTNGGSSWSTQTSGTSEALNGVTFIDASNGWAVGTTGKILNTTNGGSSWSTQTSGTSENLAGVEAVVFLAPPVPALSTLGLVLLVAILGGATVLFMRRRVIAFHG